MFKEILVVFVALVAISMAYPENETPKRRDQDASQPQTQSQTHGVDEGLSTAESANPWYGGGFYGGYRPYYYGGYRPYYGGFGYGGYGGYPYYGGFRKHFYWG